MPYVGRWSGDIDVLVVLDWTIPQGIICYSDFVYHLLYERIADTVFSAMAAVISEPVAWAPTIIISANMITPTVTNGRR